MPILDIIDLQVPSAFGDSVAGDARSHKKIVIEVSL